MPGSPRRGLRRMRCVSQTLAFALAMKFVLTSSGLHAQTQPGSELPDPFAMTLEAKRFDLPDPFAMTLEAKRFDLPDPFAMTLEAKRFDLPDPFAMTLEAKRLELPDPFAMTLEAKRLELPDPFAMTLEAKRLELPDPFAMTLEAKRFELPDPFAMTLEAKRFELPDPFAMTLEAKRFELPDPFAMTLEAKRLELPEPFTMTLEAMRGSCDVPQQSLDAVRSLTNEGQLGAAEAALAKIDAGGCPEAIAAVAAAEAGIATAVDALGQEAEAAGCDVTAFSAIAGKLDAANHPKLGEAKTRVAHLSTAVGAAEDAYSKATTAFIAGDFAASLAGLRDAQSTLGDADAECPDLSQRITSAISITETTRSNVEKVDAAIAACNAEKMAHYSDLIRALPRPHPLLAARLETLDGVVSRLAQADAAVERAQTAYAEGQLAGAHAALGEADAALEALNSSPDCPEPASRIADVRDEIATLENLLGQADAALKACEADAIDEWLGRLAGYSTHVLVREKIAALEKAKEGCGGGWPQSWRGQVKLTDIVADGERMSLATATARYLKPKPQAPSSAAAISSPRRATLRRQA